MYLRLIDEHSKMGRSIVDLLSPVVMHNVYVRGNIFICIYYSPPRYRS